MGVSAPFNTPYVRLLFLVASTGQACATAALTDQMIAPTDHRTLSDCVHTFRQFLERCPIPTAVQASEFLLTFSSRCLDKLGIYSENGITDGSCSWSYTGG